MLENFPIGMLGARSIHLLFFFDLENPFHALAAVAWLGTEEGVTPSLIEFDYQTPRIVRLDVFYPFFPTHDG